MKVTKLPPAPQEVFFQEHQFDRDIGKGSDPQQFVNGRAASRSNANKGRARKTTDDKEVQTKAAKFMRKAKVAVKGHPKEKEILKVLRRGE
jgi:hypothetical protein